MAALHHDGSAGQRPIRTVASRSSSPAANVKKSEPPKNTHASAAEPTSWVKPGKGPMKKHVEPIAKAIAMVRSHSARVSARGAKASEWPTTASSVADAGLDAPALRLVQPALVLERLAGGGDVVGQR